METDTQKKTGLVLEGGGMRGLFTAGVLDVWMEEGITFDGVIGVSAGAIHGATYVANQPGRNIRYFLRFCKDRNFMSWYSFFTTGDVVGEKLCYDRIPNELDPFDYEAFKASKTDFYAGVTNVKTGGFEAILVKDAKEQMQAIRASAALPFVSKLVKVEDSVYLDGGIGDSIPVLPMKKLGYEKLVVIMTREETYRKGKEAINSFAKTRYKAYPEFIKAIESRHIRYNAERNLIADMEKRGEVLVIRPSEAPHIHRMEHSKEKIQNVYDLGRRDGRETLSRVKDYLSQ